MRYLGQDELMMGVGTVGEVRQASDGNLYQWVEGIDGLGNPIGFWKRLKRWRRKARGILRKAMPMATKLAPVVPGYGPAIAKGLTTASPWLKRAGLLGYDGLGALYEAPDGTLYQMQGLEDDDLDGFGQEDLYGLHADDLYGLDEDDDFQGLDAEDFEGLDADDMADLEGYLYDQGTSGLDAYLPDRPPTTRQFVPPARPPEMWAPLW